MIQSFRDRGTHDIFRQLNTRAARATLPPQAWSVAYRKLSHLDSAGDPSDLLHPRGNRLEHLKGDRRGEYSIRINDQYRICFRWGAAGPEEVEIVDYH